jgi:hypothetical protein
MKLKLVAGPAAGSSVCSAPFAIAGATVIGSDLIYVSATRADFKRLSSDETAKLTAVVARLIRNAR